MHLAEDRGAGVEHAGHDRGVDVGHVAFERRGAVHHRHAGDADIVLERDPLALELALGRALDLALDVPEIVFVLVALRAVARRARIFHRRQVVGQRLQQIVGGDVAGKRLLEEGDVGVRQVHAEFGTDLRQFGRCRHLHACHGVSPSVVRSQCALMPTNSATSASSCR